ncbi:MAG: hypothetical protein HY036_05825 [Nitrospirae bacterium]|nr:hypothetical protein [Nitrospirota bacterium]MBI3352079.1 hypothetical protein [Nitrospirota bacterium]
MRKKVFVPEKLDGRENAVIGWFGFGNETFAIAEGYYRGANHLVDEALERHEMDFLVYPICFLYRHFIEIILKEIVSQFEALEGTSFQKKNPTHTLQDLFSYISKKCAKQWKDPIPTIVKQVIKEFDVIDPKAQVFRYDTDKNGKKFFGGHVHIGLESLRKKMQKVRDFLMGINAALSDELDCKKIMESY